MNHQDINTSSFRQKIEEDSFVLIDVRTHEEFSEGHIRGAVNIDIYKTTFEEEIDEFDKRKRYLIYCRSGNRSKQAMYLMRDLGFEEVYNLEHGIISWNEHKFPLE